MMAAAKAIAASNRAGITPPHAALAPSGQPIWLDMARRSAKALMARNDPVMVIWARFAGQMLLVCIVFAPRLRTHMRTARPGL